MAVSRRTFLTASAGLVGVSAVGSSTTAADELSARSIRVRDSTRGASFDPWLEIDRAAFEHNVAEVARLAGGRPILAVVKNNAYGLGLTTVGPLLDSASPIAGLAVVKPEQALLLRDAGVRKPILLMGLFDETDGAELVARGIELAPFTEDAGDRLSRLAGKLRRRIPVHLYLDTGMSRLGMPYHRALPWIESLVSREELRIEGTFTSFTEEDDFDPEQLDRFLTVTREARQRGLKLGRLHAASSHGLFFRPDAHLDMVRPGLALYGAHPSGARETGSAKLRPLFRLRARAVRVEQLRIGDSVSYGRNYVAEKPTWIATLPVGHADGYPRRAVNGCEVLIGKRLYPVIGAVSASHTIIELGGEKTVRIGDAATLIGPDDPALHPNTVAERAGISVYDVLMHLGAGLPKVVRR